MDADIEEAVRELREVRKRGALLCPQCETAYQASDRFCVRCGTALPKVQGGPAQAGLRCLLFLLLLPLLAGGVHAQGEDLLEDDVITVDSVHIIAESFGQVLRISEIHLFGNSGDRAYVGGREGSEQGTTVQIPLPQGAVGLAIGEGTPEGRFVEAAGVLLDSEPVPPGSETSLAFFSYHLMVTGETIPFERRFAYPVGNLNLLVLQPGLDLSSNQLLAVGTEIFQGQQYAHYVGRNLGPDTPLVVEFVAGRGMAGDAGTLGMPAGSDFMVPADSARGNQDLLRLLGMGLSALVVVGGLAYAFLTRPSIPGQITPVKAALVRSPGHRFGSGTPQAGLHRTPLRKRYSAVSEPKGKRCSAGQALTSVSGLAADPKTRPLVIELADLEDAYRAGQVETAAYERRRAEIYNRLKSSHP